MKKVISLVISFAILMTLSIGTVKVSAAGASTLPKLSGTLANGVLTVTVTGAKAATYSQVNIVATNNTQGSPDKDPSNGAAVPTVGTITVGQDNNTIKFTNRKGSDYTVAATLKNKDGTDGAAIASIEVKKKVITAIGVSYSTRVQSIGWLAAVTNGALSGTSGKGLRVETIKMNLIGKLPKGAKIIYKTYVQNRGWQNSVSNGGQSGTNTTNLRIEALKVTLNNMPGYQVKYRVNMQRSGWLPFQKTKNGTNINSAIAAGAAGKGLRIEAIKVIVEKVKA